MLTSDTATLATTLGEARPAMATATATTTRVSRPRLLHNLPRQHQQHSRQQQQQQQRMQTMTMTRMFGLQLLLLRTRVLTRATRTPSNLHDYVT